MMRCGSCAKRGRAFGKQRWARSVRPRLRQLPQAGTGARERHPASSLREWWSPQHTSSQKRSAEAGQDYRESDSEASRFIYGAVQFEEQQGGLTLTIIGEVGPTAGPSPLPNASFRPSRRLRPHLSRNHDTGERRWLLLVLRRLLRRTDRRAWATASPVCGGDRGEIAGGGLSVETRGLLQYHLSGSDHRFQRERPTKLMLHFVRTGEGPRFPAFPPWRWSRRRRGLAVPVQGWLFDGPSPISNVASGL